MTDAQRLNRLRKLLTDFRWREVPTNREAMLQDVQKFIHAVNDALDGDGRLWGDDDDE